MRDARTVADDLAAAGAVAVLRLDDASRIDWLGETLCEAGLAALEVTMTVPDTFGQIRRLAERLGPGHLVGAGTVLTADDARRAFDAGAAYVVSPAFAPGVVEAARELGALAVPGCFTPTEIFHASSAGAEFVKVFPADVLGPPFVRAVLATMPGLRLMPTGGVTPENAGEWLRAGAAAVGVGGALLDKRAIEAADAPAIAGRARTLLENVRRARGENGGV